MLGGKTVCLIWAHLIDKGGYRFQRQVLRGVQLNPEAMVAERIYWAGANPSRGCCISNPPGTNQPRHGATPTGCGTLLPHDQRRNKQYDPSTASASRIDPALPAAITPALCFPLSFTARARKVCTSSASGSLARFPPPLPVPTPFPSLKTPITFTE